MTASPFSRRANNSSGEDFELPAAGLHPAALVALVDLGTHEEEYNHKVNVRRLLYIAWELVGSENNDGEPFVVGEGFTDSLGKKSNLRKLIEGWRSRPFASEEEFDPIVLLGQKCLVNLSLGETSAGKRFTQVNSVSPPMKGQSIPDPIHEMFAWHFSQIDPPNPPPVPAWMSRHLGKTLLERIKLSREWAELESKGAFEARRPANGNGAGAATGTSNGHSGSIKDRHPAPAETARSLAGVGAGATAEREDCHF